MARRFRRSRFPQDLDPYIGCPADEPLGYTPLAIGWLRRDTNFATGSVAPDFLEKLALHCQAEYRVCETRAARLCPLCNQAVPGFGTGEIRVIGADDIYAAPDLVLHFVEVHAYRPPAAFVGAVRQGPPPTAPEHRALRRALADR
jgi:hypothetical protein